MPKFPGPIIPIKTPKPKGRPATITGRALHSQCIKHLFNKQSKPGYIKPFVKDYGKNL